MRKIFNYEQGIDMKWAEVILRNKLEAHPRFFKKFSRNFYVLI